MKYSAKQDTNNDGVINADDEDTKVGQKFWQEKLVECLKNMGTANIVITKEGYTNSTFDASRANGMTAETAKSVIVYANFDPSNEEKAVDLFIWDESKGSSGAEVSLGNGLTFPMDLNTFADKMIKDAAKYGYTEKATTSADIAAIISDVFNYIGKIEPLLQPFFNAFDVNEDNMSLTMKYADLIDVAWKAIDAFVADSDRGWVDANLDNLLAAIFGSVPEGGEALVPADKVVFTLESFEYAGTEIYRKAA